MVDVLSWLILVWLSGSLIWVPIEIIGLKREQRRRARAADVALQKVCKALELLADEQRRIGEIGEDMQRLLPSLRMALIELQRFSQTY